MSDLRASFIQIIVYVIQNSFYKHIYGPFCPLAIEWEVNVIIIIEREVNVILYNDVMVIVSG